MTDPLFDDDDEANTPLTAEEREQLIPSYITLRRELNEAEQINIADALKWVSRRRREVLDQAFLSGLHKRMFGNVWKWAGTYRTSPRNIGIDAWRIPAEVGQVIHDTRFWIENEVYPPDEIAVRFSHRIVAIHPFPNGNGRFSRLIGDMLALQLGRPRFTWGSANLVDANETRKAYVNALRAADGHDIEPLLAFARA
ncbi:MAG: mobile mystery protein B [Sphingomonas sp.]